jgi:hypothetical protein
VARVRAHGGAVQVETFKPTLKAPGSKRLKLQDEKMLSNMAFKFNLRRYTTVNRAIIVTASQMAVYDKSKERIQKETGMKVGPARVSPRHIMPFTQEIRVPSSCMTWRAIRILTDDAMSHE